MELPEIIYLLVIITAGISVAIVFALTREKKQSFRKPSSDDSIPQTISRESDLKSTSIINRAVKQARDIIVQAELTGIKEVARSKHDTQELEDVFEKHLEKLTEQSTDHLERTSRKIEEHYIELFKKTEEYVTKQIMDNQQRIVNQLDMVTREADRTIKTQSEAAREELIKRMDIQLAESKKTLVAYQQKRIEQIDREIIDIVAKTVQQTLGKTISMKDHANLIIQALERAKKEGFLS